MAEKKVFWQGTPPAQCDIGQEDLNKIGVFYDAMIHSGQWGNLCPKCFGNHGVGLGTGRGQKYVQQSDGKWLKTEG
jgi:hypothetical protein